MAAAQEVDAGEGQTATVVRKMATLLVAKLASEHETDPEIARSSVANARDRADEIVFRHGGMFVAALGGDRAWVFGVPLIREDDVLRALRAADEMRSALEASVAPELGRLTVRIGVATGEVIAESASDLFGEPLNRAIALAQTAAAGEVSVADATRSLAFNAILVEPAPDGVAWRMDGMVAQRPAAIETGTAMVDREEERALARAAFTRTRRSGEANLLTVVGEAGIGKSRLVQELGSQLASEAIVLTGRCASPTARASRSGRCGRRSPRSRPSSHGRAFAGCSAAPTTPTWSRTSSPPRSASASPRAPASRCRGPFAACSRSWPLTARS